MSISNNPTIDFYQTIQYAYDFYNKELFASELNPVLLTLRATNSDKTNLTVKGYYHKKAFSYKNGAVSEIALNVNAFYNTSIVDILSTLVHEMVHQWRSEVAVEPVEDDNFGGHDKVWADKMFSLGLIPSSTGLPGGKKMAKNMSHYPNKEGLFSEKTFELIKEGFNIPLFDVYSKLQNNNKKHFIPINEDMKEMWLEEASSEEEKQLIEKSMGALSDDPNIVSADISELTVPEPKPKKPREPIFKYICPECKNKVSGADGIYIVCGNCDVPYEQQELKRKK